MLHTKKVLLPICIIKKKTHALKTTFLHTWWKKLYSWQNLKSPYIERGHSHIVKSARLQCRRSLVRALFWSTTGIFSLSTQQWIGTWLASGKVKGSEKRGLGPAFQMLYPGYDWAQTLHSPNTRKTMATMPFLFYIVCHQLVNHIIEPLHDKTNKMTCVPSKDSDQPGHPPSLIRVLALRFMGSSGPSAASWGQGRLWLDLNLCWAHVILLVLSCGGSYQVATGEEVFELYFAFIYSWYNWMTCLLLCNHWLVPY